MFSKYGLKKPKTPSATTSLGTARAPSAIKPYSALMRKLDETPRADPINAWEAMYRRYPANTDTGRRLRQAVAKTWLRDMDRLSAEVAEREAAAAEITESLARMQAEHELNMQYLVHFGVTLQEQEQLRSILEEVQRDGQLTIREAARRAHEIAQRNGDSSVSDGLSAGGVSI